MNEKSWARSGEVFCTMVSDWVRSENVQLMSSSAPRWIVTFLVGRSTVEPPSHVMAVKDQLGTAATVTV